MKQHRIRVLGCVFLCLLVVALAGCAGAITDDGNETESADDPAEPAASTSNGTTANVSDDSNETVGTDETDETVGTDADVPDDIEAEFAAADPPGAIAATLETEMTIDGVPFAFSEAVWMRAGGERRSESELTSSAQVTVSDGETVWTFPANGSYGTSHDAREPFDAGLERLYEDYLVLFEVYEIEAVETATVDGHETYRVAFDPNATKTDASEGLSETDDAQVPSTDEDVDRLELWLEQGTMFPIRYELGDENASLTMTYRGLEFNPELDDDLFEPPEDVEFVDTTLPSHETYDRVADADAAVSFDVDEPTTVPAGYELDQVTVSASEDDRTNVRLAYTGPDGALLSVEASDDLSAVEFDGEAVDLDGPTGTYTEQGTTDTHIVTWTCDDTDFYVGAPTDLERETVIDVASSISCE